MVRQLNTVEDYAKASVFSEPQLRYYIARGHENGLIRCGAIVRVGRRVYVDVDAFGAWIDQQTAIKTGVQPDRSQAFAA